MTIVTWEKKNRGSKYNIAKIQIVGQITELQMLIFHQKKNIPDSEGNFTYLLHFSELLLKGILV